MTNERTVELKQPANPFSVESLVDETTRQRQDVAARVRRRDAHAHEHVGGEP